MILEDMGGDFDFGLDKYLYTKFKKKSLLNNLKKVGSHLKKISLYQHKKLLKYYENPCILKYLSITMST